MSGNGPDPGPVERAFEERFGARPAATASAPGRINLIGGHVDYTDGVVLPVGIDRGTVVGARARNEDVIRVHSMALEETHECSIGKTPESGPHTSSGPRTCSPRSPRRRSAQIWSSGGTW